MQAYFLSGVAGKYGLKIDRHQRVERDFLWDLHGEDQKPHGEHWLAR